ncbi:alpha/beta hydrolase [Longirhabdus pacifica]|uniref:alpha/beta hydrolase n=1 Tax=Longirhabdus pacifica TaxID=2305227 RepID=UPI001008EECA|nr:alpha/beta hydrolase [Longirhabdus pacifica]
MSVHPQMDKLLQRISARMKELGHPPMSQLQPEASRFFYGEARKMFEKKREPGVTVIEKNIMRTNDPALPIVIYKPEHSSEKLPAIVYFHGGGWVFGDVDSVDDFCSYMAKQAECIVISVDYRLAPEHQYPLPVQDAVDAVQWSYDHIAQYGGDPDRLAVGGVSSGGNLAAAAAITLQQSSTIQLAAQLLIVPVTNYDFETASYNAGYTYSLTKETMMWFWQHYLQDVKQGDEVLASPLRIKDGRGLPPTLIYTAQYDPLADDGRLYAEKLEQFGVPVQHTCYEGFVHNFTNMMHLVGDAKLAVKEMSYALKNVLHDGEK